MSKRFESTYAAYTHLLFKYEEMQAAMQLVDMQMTRLKQNVKEGNLIPGAHAVTELGYIINASSKLGIYAGELNQMSSAFKKDVQE